jgi:hypothetical protein
MATRRTHAAYLKKEPSKVQGEFAAWIEKTTGHVVPAGDVALVQRLYPLYLKSDEVVKAREAAAAQREKEARAAEAAKVAKKREKLARIEAERAKLLADLGIENDGPELSVVPDSVTDEEWTDEATGLVLGTTDDEFVEPEADPEDADDFEEESDEDLWEDPDEVEDF